MALPIRTRPRFSHSRSLPSGSFHKPLVLIHQRADRNENHNHRKLTKLITWITALSYSMKLWAMPCRASQGHGGGVWQNVVHWRGEWQTTSVFLPWEPHEQYEKAEKTLKNELPRSVGAQYATGEEWRNNSRKNEATEPKWKQHAVVDVTGDGSKTWCFKENIA